MREPDVSVNICTYNRCGILSEALEGVLSQQIRDGKRYEVIVVDNNSTDETRQVVESFVARGHENLRYVFEGRQGLSHARNAAVSAARSPILAFTDDDVRVKPDWVATIKRMLDNHPEVDCVGGKVLPHWTFAPPSWLTSEHWAPLALVDYGDQPFYVNAGNQLCLLTANMAIRKDALERIGGFQPALQRVQNRVGLHGRSRAARPALESRSTGALHAGAGCHRGRRFRSPVQDVPSPLAYGTRPLLRPGPIGGNGTLTERLAVRCACTYVQARGVRCSRVAWQSGTRQPDPRVRLRGRLVVLRRVLQQALPGFQGGRRPRATFASLGDLRGH